MDKSKEEALEYAKQHIPDSIAGRNGLRLMLLGSYLEKKRMEEAEKVYARLEKEYKEYQMHQRLIKQVTKSN